MAARTGNERLRAQSWEDPLYKLTFTLVQGPFTEARRWLEQHFEDDDVWPGTQPTARTTFHERGEIVFWFRPTLDVGTAFGAAVIAHEALHGASFGLRDRGLRFTDASEEAFAYFVEYLTRELHLRLQKSR